MYTLLDNLYLSKYTIYQITFRYLRNAINIIENSERQLEFGVVQILTLFSVVHFLKVPT